MPDLLRQLDGYTISVNGQPRTLHTSGLAVVPLDMNLLESVLDLLTNPNVVFLLLTIGAQALLIELSNPGGWIPGVIGAVSLALAFYGLGVLPVNWFGLVFIAIAFVLFILEVHAPTHGALAATGTASLVVGALVLFNSPGSPDFFRVSVPLVVFTSLLIALAFVVLLTFALRAQRRPVAVGIERLIGREGEMRTLAIDPGGRGDVDGAAGRRGQRPARARPAGGGHGRPGAKIAGPPKKAMTFLQLPLTATASILHKTR